MKFGDFSATELNRRIVVAIAGQFTKQRFWLFLVFFAVFALMSGVAKVVSLPIFFPPPIISIMGIAIIFFLLHNFAQLVVCHQFNQLFSEKPVKFSTSLLIAVQRLFPMVVSKIILMLPLVIGTMSLGVGGVSLQGFTSTGFSSTTTGTASVVNFMIHHAVLVQWTAFLIAFISLPLGFYYSIPAIFCGAVLARKSYAFVDLLKEITFLIRGYWWRTAVFVASIHICYFLFSLLWLVVGIAAMAFHVLTHKEVFVGIYSYLVIPVMQLFFNAIVVVWCHWLWERKNNHHSSA